MVHFNRISSRKLLQRKVRPVRRSSKNEAGQMPAASLFTKLRL